MEIEPTNKSSRASGSQAEDLENVGSRPNLERTASGADSVAQQSDPSRPISPNVVIDHPRNVTQVKGDKHFSAYQKTARFCSRVHKFSQRNCMIRVFSRKLKSPN